MKKGNVGIEKLLQQQRLFWLTKCTIRDYFKILIHWTVIHLGTKILFTPFF